MNDPSATDIQDEAIMEEDLRNEYMEMAMRGDLKAHAYAQMESDKWNIVSGVTIMRLFEMTRHVEEPDNAGNVFERLGMWVIGTRQHLKEVLEKHVAPQWAEREFPKRVKALREMREEWQDKQAVVNEEARS